MFKKEDLVKETKQQNWFQKLGAVLWPFSTTYGSKTVEVLMDKVIQCSNALSIRDNKIKQLTQDVDSAVKLRKESKEELETTKEALETAKATIKELKSLIKPEPETVEEPEQEPAEESGYKLNISEPGLYRVDATDFTDVKIEKVDSFESVAVAPKKEKKAPKAKKNPRDNKPKLDCEKIQKAKDRVADGELLKDIAGEYNVDPSTLTNALKGKTYKHCVLVDNSKKSAGDGKGL